MKNIDLKYLYPERYIDHHLVKVSKKVYNILIQKEILSEMNYQFTVNNSKEIMNELIKTEMIELMLKKLNDLSLKQQNRIYEKYFLEMSYSEIARLENCSECAIRRSINRGINQLRSKVCGKL